MYVVLPKIPSKINISHSQKGTLTFTVSGGKKYHPHEKFCVRTKWRMPKRNVTKFCFKWRMPKRNVTKFCFKQQGNPSKSSNPYSHQNHQKVILAGTEVNQSIQNWSNSITIPKIMKIYNILNNTARNLYNTEEARDVPYSP